MPELAIVYERSSGDMILYASSILVSVATCRSGPRYLFSAALAIAFASQVHAAPLHDTL